MRAMLPFGLVYLAFAVLYVGYYLISGQLGPSNAIYALTAVASSVFFIVQGRRYRRDPKFR